MPSKFTKEQIAKRMFTSADRLFSDRVELRRDHDILQDAYDDPTGLVTLDLYANKDVKETKDAIHKLDWEIGRMARQMEYLGRQLTPSHPQHEVDRRYGRTKENPLSTGRTVALVAVGAAVLGGIGYYLYTLSQTATTAAAPALPIAPVTPSMPSPVAAPTQTPTDQSAMNLAEQEASSSFESSIPD